MDRASWLSTTRDDQLFSLRDTGTERSWSSTNFNLQPLLRKGLEEGARWASISFGNQVFLFGKSRYSGANRFFGELRQSFLSSERSGSQGELVFGELRPSNSFSEEGGS
jgi:hypothetical protein